MTESREELIETLINADNEMGPDPDGYPWADHVLDALLAHPGAVLAELENAPCQTCRGVGERMVEALDPRKMDPYTIEAVGPCDACGGSGKLGRDEVLRHYGMERVGWMATGEDDDGVPYLYADDGAPDERDLPVFVPVPVPEPSEGDDR